MGRWRLGQLYYPHHPSQGKPNQRELGEMNCKYSNSFFLAAVFGTSGAYTHLTHAGCFTPHGNPRWSEMRHTHVKSSATSRDSSVIRVKNGLKIRAILNVTAQL